ncbi:MAG: isoleucine--tRNA ligase [Alphaproteobacteria bacterium]|nr:isoleucine--tRNA ligase [Alphaproteobacteria bacterium]
MDYKNTVFLPKTDFSMKANLSQKEPEILAFWEKIDLNQKLFENKENRKKFVLHDGPPYANGDAHVGHAFNRCLKDMILKYQRLSGKYTPFVPGWDCHGLPIEWKVEERYRAQNKNKDDVPILEFRKECRDYAAHWVEVQKKSLKRLGAFGTWDDPYLTMKPESEAIIVKELHKFLMSGDLYRGVKPVQWSVVEKTALAEAEVEYKDKVSPSIYVKFALDNPKDPLLHNAFVVIWTTTPWTLPANRAVAYSADISYVLLKTNQGHLLVAEDLVKAFVHQAGLDAYEILKSFKGSEFKGLFCRHPLYGKGYDFTVPLLEGDHVTTDQGTGFVHTAPSHGLEDFVLGKTHNLEIPELIGEDGVYHSHVPLFAGLHVFKANDPVIEALTESETLVARSDITHSYPHSWRSKAPLIFRTTAQWFISMDKNGLREEALKAINDVQWLPPQSKNRIQSMVENRPDWCLSRQRPWGVPIAIFVHKETGLPLKDAAVNQRIFDLFSKEGSDAWFARSASDFLGSEYNANDYEMIKDVVDVWFESGVTHAFVLENNPNLSWPADLYLEGSDQHRGWFQSSLMASVGTRQSAPYKAVLTHGYIVGGDGKKMSKSSGNALTLDDVIKDYGADILKLWAVGSDYNDDIRLSRDHFKRYEDIYRRLRNTLRYLLGNLQEKEVPSLEYKDLPELERWVLHRLSVLDQCIREKTEAHDLNGIFKELYHFCNVELSSFYFDIRKDVLYCDARTSLKYQATQVVLYHLFRCLTIWLSPIISFTAEEAWQHRFKGSSVHLERLPDLDPKWFQEALDKKWTVIRYVRRVVTGALEQERAAGTIGSSLQGCPHIYVEDENTYHTLKDQPLSEICITSQVQLVLGKPERAAFTLEDVAGVFVLVGLAEGNKCERCWQVLPEVGKSEHHPHICTRCEDAVESL